MTIVATAIVWEAVSVVASDVTDRPAPVVAQRDVVVALKNGSSTTTTVPTALSVAPRTVPATKPASGATFTVPTTPAVRTGPATASPGAATTTTVPVAPTPTTVPSRTTTPTTAAPAGGTATYSTAGGVVAVACTGFNTIKLVAALPYDGFQAFVVSGGPQFVGVSFVGAGQNVPVGAACFFGQPFEVSRGHSTP